MPFPSDSAKAAALKRAIMRVKPEYFSWSVEEQEQYHVRKPDGETFRLQQVLLKELFDIRVKTQKELDAILKNFDDAHYLILNSATLLIKGIGADLFFLNEWLGEKRTLLDFETLYDYSYDDYCFQEQARTQEDPSYTGKLYRGDLHACWARLMVNGAFSYATLSSMASYLHGIIDTIGTDKIGDLIPHEYVHGEHHGKRAGKGFLFDLRVVANGMEPHLEELRARFWQYLAERYEALLDAYDKKALCRVYIFDKAKENDPHIDFVFSDQTALKKVRFKHFMADCRQIPGDYQELRTVEAQEITAIIDFLEREYQDIVEHFDPKIVRFRKKRKIVIAEEAAQDFF